MGTHPLSLLARSGEHVAVRHAEGPFRLCQTADDRQYWTTAAELHPVDPTAPAFVVTGTYPLGTFLVALPHGPGTHEWTYVALDADGHPLAEGTTTSRAIGREGLEGWYDALRFHADDAGAVNVLLTHRTTGERIFVP